MSRPVAAAACLCLCSAVYAETLQFSLTLGGSGFSDASAVAVGRDGSIYVAGSTAAPGLASSGAAQSALAGASDAFVAKYSADGTLLYFTYLGGSGDETATGIAVDSQGSAYVCGYTRSRDFPAVNAFQPALEARVNGGGFVAKVAADGSAFVYSTYLGGNKFDIAYAIAVDSNGSAYVTGSAYSTDFPMVNPIQATSRGNSAFVAQFAPDGRSLLFSTYLGGTGDDRGYGIAVDAQGLVYVTGETSSPDFPMVNATQAFAGNSDAFVVKLDPSGPALIYSTFLGGSGADHGRAIAVDSGGSAYITGDTLSVDFPVVHPFQPALSALLATKSTDGGNTWTAITKGLATLTPNQLLIDPSNTSTLYVGSGETGIFKSTDGGASWTTANNGLAPAQQGLGVRAAAIDRKNPSTLYAALAAVDGAPQRSGRLDAPPARVGAIRMAASISFSASARRC